jgi:hypothetical protein|uniref:HMG box domain-containing protein n=1 Tax=viral metagenome TaxID=1070528 RepID=A0A6C0JSG6_9ZZZZ
MSSTVANNTQQIIDKFVELIDVNKDYTCKELTNILSEAYKLVTKGNKKTKTTKAPTKYNLFVKENISKLKMENPTLSRQELMKKVSELWQEEKNKKNEEETEKEVEKEVESEKEVEKEVESEKEVNNEVESDKEKEEKKPKKKTPPKKK